MLAPLCAALIVDVLDLRWEDGALQVVSRVEDQTLDVQIAAPVPLRDLDGDGAVEAIFSDAGCSTSARDQAGRWGLSTASRCCGC